MLPHSVQEQIDAANKLQEQIITPSTEEVGNPALAAAEHVESQSVVEQPQVAAQAAESKDASYWRHRFDVLQGKYNAEVPALRKEIAELVAKQANPEPTGSAVERTQSAVSALTEAEIEEYGPDLVNLIRRVVGNGADDDKVKSIKGEVEQLKQEREQERQQDAEARFWSELERQVPNYIDINNLPEFHEWLATVDPLSGVSRQVLLENAQANSDPFRVAAIFKSFGGKPAVKPGNKIPEEMVQPRQSRAVPGNDLTGEKKYTGAEITEFYRNKASYSKDQAAAIEADIFAAQAQGRILR